VRPLTPPVARWREEGVIGIAEKRTYVGSYNLTVINLRRCRQIDHANVVSPYDERDDFSLDVNLVTENTQWMSSNPNPCRGSYSN